MCSRTTKDIDFLIDASAENVSRVRSALAILADNAAAEILDTDMERHSVVRVADEVIVDLLSRAYGVDYEEAAGDEEVIEIDGVKTPIASKRTLVRTKDTIRPGDAADKQFLLASSKPKSEKSELSPRRATLLPGRTRMERVRPASVESAFHSAPRHLAMPFWSVSNTWSRLKLPTFWLGGNSLKVARNCPTYCCAGTRRNRRSILQCS